MLYGALSRDAGRRLSASLERLAAQRGLHIIQALLHRIGDGGKLQVGGITTHALLHHAGGADATLGQLGQLGRRSGLVVIAPSEMPISKDGLCSGWGTSFSTASSPRFLSSASALANLPM